MDKLYHMMVEQFQKLETKVATKDCISNLLKTIENQSKKISVLEDRIVVVESHISRLRMTNDDAVQYQRRLCLGIDGLDLPPAGQKESAEECLPTVKNVFVEHGVAIPDDVVDRAHRIGKITNYKGKQNRDDCETHYMASWNNDL